MLLRLRLAEAWIVAVYVFLSIPRFNIRACSHPPLANHLLFALAPPPLPLLPLLLSLPLAAAVSSSVVSLSTMPTSPRTSTTRE